MVERDDAYYESVVEVQNEETYYEQKDCDESEMDYEEHLRKEGIRTKKFHIENLIDDRDELQRKIDGLNEEIDIQTRELEIMESQDLRERFVKILNSEKFQG